MGESEVVTNDRIEEELLRGAEDHGGYVRVGGRRMDPADVPSADEWGRLA